jgi:hypothetical protein
MRKDLINKLRNAYACYPAMRWVKKQYKKGLTTKAVINLAPDDWLIWAWNRIDLWPNRSRPKYELSLIDKLTNRYYGGFSIGWSEFEERRRKIMVRAFIKTFCQPRRKQS